MDISEVTFRKILFKVSQPNFSVNIGHNMDTGELLWAIVHHRDPDFWIDAFENLDDAVEFCKKCGWKIEHISEDRTVYYQKLYGTYIENSE